MKQSRGLMAPNVQKAIQDASVNISGKVETIYQPLYDYQTLSATAVAQQTFFQTPVGQGGKSLSDTNMELAGQLPKGQNFLITGIQVEVLPAADPTNATIGSFINDVYEVTKGGVLVLRIGSKEYVRQGNLMKFPPVNRIQADAATGLTAESTQYAAACGREFSVVDLLLTSNQNFSVELRDLPALPSGVAGRIGITLNGYLMRNAQ